jgi:hypothetical protein
MKNDILYEIYNLNIIEDLLLSFRMNPYQAFDHCWIVLVKLADLLPDESEHKRMMTLFELMEEDELKAIISDPGV